MTTIMLHLSIHQPASLCSQTWSTWLRFSKLHMVGHGNWGEGTGHGTVRKLGYSNEKLLYGSICSKLLAECAGMWKRYLIYPSENMYSSGSEIERPQSFSMQLSIHTNDTLAFNNNDMIICIQSLIRHHQLEPIQGERQQSINNFRSYK